MYSDHQNFNKMYYDFGSKEAISHLLRKDKEIFNTFMRARPDIAIRYPKIDDPACKILIKFKNVSALSEVIKFLDREKNDYLLNALTKRSISANFELHCKTLRVQKSVCPILIGRHGLVVKELAGIHNLEIMSPDKDKEPIFVLYGRRLEDIGKCLNDLLVTIFFRRSDKTFPLPIKSYEFNFVKKFFRSRSFELEFRVSSDKFSDFMCFKCQNEEFPAICLPCGHRFYCEICVRKKFSEMNAKCCCNTRITQFEIQHSDEVPLNERFNRN